MNLEIGLETFLGKGHGGNARLTLFGGEGKDLLRVAACESPQKHTVPLPEINGK